MRDQIIAGFRNGKLLSATRDDPPDKNFVRRCADRRLEMRRVSWDEALRAASPGMRKSLRMLKRSMQMESGSQAPTAPGASAPPTRSRRAAGAER
jgi:hypothetical protein